MHFPKADSDQTISSSTSLSDGDGYSPHRNALPTLLSTHLLPSAVLILQDTPITLPGLCIFHICFISKWEERFEFCCYHWKELFNLTSKSFYFSFGLCNSFWVALYGGNPEALCANSYMCLFPLPWWQRGTDRCLWKITDDKDPRTVVLTQKYWAMQVKHTSRN